jgi:polyhydroxyalkanoate synthesis regulator phasin
MQQQLQLGALQQQSAGQQEMQVLDKSLQGLANQLTKEGLAPEKKASIEKAQQDLNAKKASLAQQDSALKSATSKNTVQGALYIEAKDTGFLSVEAGLAYIQQFLVNGGNNDMLSDYLDLTVSEQEQKEQEAAKDTKDTASVSDAALKASLTDAQRQSIYDAFIEAFHQQKEVHYAQFVQQLTTDFGSGNKQNYENVDLLLTDFDTEIAADNDIEAAIKIGEAIDELETDRQDTGQILLSNLSLIGLVEEQEGLLYDTALQIEQHRIDIIDLIGEITAEEAYGSVERMLNDEPAMRAELQELENKALEGPLDSSDLDRQASLQSSLNSMQETDRRIASLKDQEKSKVADIDYSIDDFRYFLNQYLQLNVGVDSNDKILDYVDHFENQLVLQTGFNFNSKNLRFYGSGDYIIMPNAEDIKSDASIELFQDTFELKGQGFEFKQADSHITLLNGTAVIPTLQAGDSAATGDQYTFKSLALSLQSDLKSQIIAQSNRTIIGIALRNSTGDRGLMNDGSHLKKDGDHNFDDGISNAID